MKALLAVIGMSCAVMCLAVLAVVELIARYLPVLIIAALAWAGWRVWRARRRAPLRAAPIVVDPEPRHLPTPLSTHRDGDVYLVAGDHRGLRPPLTPFDADSAVFSSHRLVRTPAALPAARRRRPRGRVRP
ncbi:hypothetical protein [Mycobacterium heckeshornense]|uniref:hypothetical protein n=1 Tax=Mycobacterium heckeshornense TaxID=110505 RepID=UPI00128EB449|nr:hypothetical protein [Mycobacterium heckeshornense]